MKVAYVVYNERPDSGLMRSQVFTLLEAVRRRAPDIEITLIALWQPWVMRRHAAGIAAMRAGLAASGIRQIDIPWAVIPTRHFAYRAVLFPFLKTWVRILMGRALAPRYDVVHCRGYLPSYAAARLKARFGHRVIFDMRSLWPREHVTINAWTADSAINHAWERLERETIRLSDASIGVSPAMVDQIREIEPAGRAVHIPICVALDRMRFDAGARTRRRAELGWTDRPIVAYQGSLGLLNSNLVEVAEYLGLVHTARPEVRFLILTSNVGAGVDEVMAKFGIPKDAFAVRHPAPDELAGWLSAADAGVHAMSPGPDSATRLGVKVVEYLACGLPIMVNPHVGAAAELVRQHRVGWVFDSRDPATIRGALDSLFAEHPMPSLRARELAAATFSVDACADRYIELYRAGNAGPILRPT
jgi:glycosyltransferase involved in cell wall biosynthesis